MDHELLWERWDEIDGLLERALDRPVQERRDFLKRECGRDLELLRAVQALLDTAGSGHRRIGPGDDILRAAFGPSPDPEEDSADALVGTTVAAYRLTRVLGVGGMGAVYLGERADGLFDRTVAVKVLRLAVDAPGLVNRFELERRILASLNHPGIAQMIDGGITGDGRPFLVMEYVDGVPIDRYSDEHRLGVVERIRLMLQVADAVEYAHRHLVIHRDLKPSNILVTPEGTAKLLDFGIAKLLEAPGEEALATTRTDARFVTPEYAAPEQLLGERVSTQTDVYALCALLYELLTGVRPYWRDEPDSVLERVIRGAAPTAPSEVVERRATAGREADAPPGGGTPAADFAARGTTRSGLRRSLDGDLDAILLRGLRSRPNERYGSVALLRDDLERHLSGRAVTARGDALLYRARKFVRRHRGPVAAAGGAFLLATGSALGLGLQRHAVIEERKRAEEAAVRASREAETSRQVTAFLVDLFEASDPLGEGGDTLTVRTLLERGADRVDEELAAQPAVRAELLQALGQVHSNRGNYLDATLMLERSVALRRDSLPDRSGLADALVRLGGAHRAAREFRPAIEAYRAALAEAGPTGDVGARAEARLGLAAAYVQLDQPDSAETEYRTGLTLLNQVENDSEDAYLNALIGLAGLVRRKGDLAGAEALYRDALARRRALRDTEPYDLAMALNNLAVVLRIKGEYQESETLYEEALELLVDLVGPGHPTALMASGNLARVYTEDGRTDQAIAVYRSRVDAAQEQWPDGHWRVASAWMNLGAVLVEVGRPDEAVDPLVEALDLAMIHLGPMHSWTQVYRGWLGTAAALSGRAAEADKLFGWSLDGLASYEGLAEDHRVQNMVRALVRAMERTGLAERAGRYREVLEPRAAS